MRPKWLNSVAIVAIASALVLLGNRGTDKGTVLLNVSYAPTEELLTDLDQQFVRKYEKETAEKLAIKQSHGGSSRQAQAVVGGLDADVVTLALPSDVDVLSKRGLHLKFDEWLPKEHIFYEEEQIYSATLRAVRYAYTSLGKSAQPGASSAGEITSAKKELYYLV